MSDTHFKDLIDSTSASLASWRNDQPDTLKAFSALGAAAGKPGALDKKTKELIALALAVGGRCEPCLAYHAQAAVRLGVTRAELEDMLGMCVYMGGGPSLMYAAKCLQAFDEFSATHS